MASLISQAKVALCDPSGVPHTTLSIDPHLQLQISAENAYGQLLSGQGWNGLYFLILLKKIGLPP